MWCFDQTSLNYWILALMLKTYGGSELLNQRNLYSGNMAVGVYVSWVHCMCLARSVLTNWFLSHMLRNYRGWRWTSSRLKQIWVNKSAHPMLRNHGSWCICLVGTWNHQLRSIPVFSMFLRLWSNFTLFVASFITLPLK